jgi:hypothetical protein
VKPAKRAPKPKKITARQTALFHGTQRPKGKQGIRVVMLDGPMRWAAPVDRGDLFEGQAEWSYALGYRTVRYLLDHVTEDVHYYRWDGK